MTEIKLYNTRTRKKELFQPIDPGNVRMYVCGPTVYDRAHIGNARPVVVFDVLFRLLRHVYGENAVTYVRNFTDVDDKINARAAETKREGETELQAIRRITDETTRWYLEDMDALGALRPTHMPRATEHIADMIAMIEELIRSGHAYEAEGHVLFDVPSWPDYGKFSRRSTDELLAGARVDVAPYKKNAMDFVLWKPSDPTLPGWDSPWGRGRPGWHIECSAMSRALLGERFDIHGGGIDLVFPHHENELAQSCCANHTDVMANVWMHNGYLMVEGEKMSKSLGNFFTVKDLLERGLNGYEVRLTLLMTAYSEPLDWTSKRFDEARKKIKRWRRAKEQVWHLKSEHYWDIRPDNTIVSLIADDLNTPAAVEITDKCSRIILDATYGSELRAMAAELFDVGSNILGFEGMYEGWHDHLAGQFEQMDRDASKRRSERDAAVQPLIDQMTKARKDKDWDTSDRIRDALQSCGVKVMIGRDQISWEYDLSPNSPPVDVEALRRLSENLQ